MHEEEDTNHPDETEHAFILPKLTHFVSSSCDHDMLEIDRENLESQTLRNLAALLRVSPPTLPLKPDNESQRHL